MCQCVSQCQGPNCATCDDPCAPPPTGANPCLNGGTCNVSSVMPLCDSNCFYAQNNACVYSILFKSISCHNQSNVSVWLMHNLMDTLVLTDAH